MKFKSLFSPVCFAITTMLLISCNSASNQERNQEVAESSATLTVEQRLENVKSDLKFAKAELAKSGDYDCCIQPGCDWCVLHEGECACHDNLTAGKEVCPGCGLGWHNGKGVVQGVKASQVKWNITHEHGEAAGHGEGEDGGEDQEGGHKH